MIRLEHVYKQYPDKPTPLVALSDINLNIQAGEIFGVIGKSGAGKSTLIRCVNLLEQPTKGKVYLDGQCLTDLPATELRHVRHQIGMIFQHFNLCASQTAFDNIALPLQLQKYKPTEIKRRVLDLLSLVGLQDKIDAYPSQLSGGQKQRVAIARALAAEPKVLLSDEGTSALDPESTDSILKLLKTINREFNLTIMLITHEMAVLKSICDRVAVIDDGKIVETADTKKIFMHPESAATKSLLESYVQLKLPDELREGLHAEPGDRNAALLRFTFSDSEASKPVIAHMIKHMEVELNILQANMEYVQHETLGTMLVSMVYEREKLERVKDYLQQHNIQLEVLGYVESHVL